MEFFGLTQYGFSQPIKFAMREDYVEPKVMKSALEILAEDDSIPLSEINKCPDMYLGRLDGYAYGSLDRIKLMKKIGYVKKIGPYDTYKVPICGSMQYGWWLQDPALKNQVWFKNKKFYPKPCSEYTRFMNHVLLTDKMKQL